MQRLGEELGRGSFGVVRKCININNGQTFAIKSIAISKAAEKQFQEAQVREFSFLLYILDLV